jgi:hypothetical protein
MGIVEIGFAGTERKTNRNAAKVAGELSSLAVWKPDDPAAIAFKETQDAAGAMRLQLLAVEARDVKRSRAGDGK